MNGRLFIVIVSFALIAVDMGFGDKAFSIEKKEMNTVVKGNNQFCMDLYNKIKDKEGENIFFSPFSISMALAMVYEGARAETEDEIQRIFRFPVDKEIRHESFAALYQQLNQENAQYRLKTANALWVQSDYTLLDEYLEIVKEYYYSYATNVDFIQATEETRKRINEWVEDQTNNKIKDLFPPGSLNPLSRLVITNAIYFKGKWVKQFDEKLTDEEDFRVNEGKTTKVPMMRRTDHDALFNYAETEELQILEMPYQGDDLTMILLLPRKGGLKIFADTLIMEKINDWKNLLAMRRVDVFIPRFTFKTKYPLNDYLKALGMTRSFTEAADLSGIDGTRNLFVQAVIHQAFIDVNEEGTEAAAATGVVAGCTAVAPEIPVFRADHPFIFLIQEKTSGNILFFGRLVDPSA